MRKGFLWFDSLFSSCRWATPTGGIFGNPLRFGWSDHVVRRSMLLFLCSLSLVFLSQCYTTPRKFRLTAEDLADTVLLREMAVGHGTQSSKSSQVDMPSQPSRLPSTSNGCPVWRPASRVGIINWTPRQDDPVVDVWSEKPGSPIPMTHGTRGTASASLRVVVFVTARNPKVSLGIQVL